MIEVRHIIFFCYTGKIYQDEDIYCTNSAITLDGLYLLQQIILKGATAEAASSHPIFWPGWKVLDFIGVLIEYLEDGKGNFRSQLEKICPSFLGDSGKWGSEFPSDFGLSQSNGERKL